MAEGSGALGNLLKQAQEMQTRIARIQEELGQKTVAGSAGGGMVQVTVNGQLNLTAVKVDPTVVNVNEREMLEDLILAAVNDGMQGPRDGIGGDEQGDRRLQNSRPDALIPLRDDKSHISNYK